jgi:hypothetical protein
MRSSRRADPQDQCGSETGLAIRRGLRSRVVLRVRRNGAPRGDIGFKKASRDPQETEFFTDHHAIDRAKLWLYRARWQKDALKILFARHCDCGRVCEMQYHRIADGIGVGATGVATSTAVLAMLRD